MSQPNVIVVVDGFPVSGLFFERLISLTISDQEGIKSDQLEITFNDGFPHFSSPRRGAVVDVAIQYGLGLFTGSYVIDRVQYACHPHIITVSGHSADLRSEMKSSKTRHWDDMSVKDIVTDIASDYDLKLRISEAVSAHVYEWIGQQDESDLNFLGRLARRHGALFTIKNGALMWLERGVGRTASGEAVPPAIIPAVGLLQGSFKMSETDVDRFKTVKAYWQDRAGAKRQEIVVAADPDAQGEKVLSDPFSSKGEAEKAGKAAVREMLRGLTKMSCTVAGRPSLMAGQPARFVGVRIGVDGKEFMLESVKHMFTKAGGLRSTISGKLKAQE